MKRFICRGGAFIVGLFLLLTPPTVAQAQSPQSKVVYSSVQQPLVREGTLALKLAISFGLGTNSEAEAESWLAERGIMPRNGWIADYPVTPDVVGELRRAVGDAADAKKIVPEKAEALRSFDRSIAVLDAAAEPGSDDVAELPPEDDEGDEESYPVAATAGSYEDNYDAGPPVVTYSTPAPDYYDQYAWVPYPFWYDGLEFSGFFILKDFDRPVFVGHRHHRAFVSNHIRGTKGNGFFRVDPVTRSRSWVPAPGGLAVRRGVLFTNAPSPTVGALRGPTSLAAQALPSSAVQTVTPQGSPARPHVSLSHERRTAPVTGGKQAGSIWQRQATPATARNSGRASVGAPVVQRAPSGGSVTVMTSQPAFQPHSSMGSQAPVGHQTHLPAPRSEPVPRAYAAPMTSVAPARSYMPPVTNFTPAFHNNTSSSPAFRGAGSFSAGRGRR
jgi:hypothetical protein